MDYSSTCMLPRKCQVLSKVHLKLLLHPSVRKPKLPRIPSMTICSFIHLSTHSLRMQLSKHRQAAVSPGTLQWQSKYSICPPGLWKKSDLEKLKTTTHCQKCLHWGMLLEHKVIYSLGSWDFTEEITKWTVLKNPLLLSTLSKNIYLFICLFCLPRTLPEVANSRTDKR